MTASVQLRCWQPQAPTDALALWAVAARQGGDLVLQYNLSWPPAACLVRIPPARATDQVPQRCDGLWQHTCVEAFVAAGDAHGYWELNLSPSGDWNVYRFAAYRSGPVPDDACGSLSCTRMGPRAAAPGGDCRHDQPRALLQLELRSTLPPSLQNATALQLGLSAVLEHDDGRLSYWALHHPGPEPDFHDARGWMLRL
jgi:hypothetical protein